MNYLIVQNMMLVMELSLYYAGSGNFKSHVNNNVTLNILKMMESSPSYNTVQMPIHTPH